MSQVVPGSRRSARARGGRIAILIGLVVVLAGACALLVTLVLPPLVVNATARVETSDTTVEAGRASIVVPAGWAVRRPVLSSPDALLITSPDGNLDVTLSPSARAPREAFSDVAPAVAGPIEETLGSGLTSVHAKTADGSITAAIGDDDGSAIVVAAAEGDIQRYTYALAELIESARVHPEPTAGAP